jgi:hypothetical protein
MHGAGRSHRNGPVPYRHFARSREHPMPFGEAFEGSDLGEPIRPGQTMSNRMDDRGFFIVGLKPLERMGMRSDARIYRYSHFTRSKMI